MDKEAIALEPEIVTFSSDHRQLLKVTNRTNQVIDNCFFCLFNTSKYSFEPDSFSLQPREHKLVTVTLKLKAVEGASKEFAYFKSKNISKRITLMNSPEPQTEQRLKTPDSAQEEINTLSSRDYKQTQKAAYDRVVAEKQAYILRLERRLEEQEQAQDSNKKSDGSAMYYLQEIRELEFKIEQLARERERLVVENIKIQSEFDEYRIMTESDMKNAQLSSKVKEYTRIVSSQKEQIKELESRCEVYLRNITEKENLMREKEIYYATKLDKVIDDERDKFKTEREQLQSQISQLNAKIQEAQQNRARAELDHQRIEELNKELKIKIKSLDQTVAQLKNQNTYYKQKIDDQQGSKQKVGHYLEIALESCRNQNQVLKKSNRELENDIIQEMKGRKSCENQAKNLQQQIERTVAQMNILKEQKNKLQEQKARQQQDFHTKMVELKQENIDLIEKMSLGKIKDADKQYELEQNRAKVQEYEARIVSLQQQLGNLKYQLYEVQQTKQKMMKKIEKYKKQARKQLKSISEGAKEDIKRIQKQKDKLTRKLEQLQLSANNQSQSRNKTHYIRTNLNESRESKQSREKQHMSQHEKRVGIKNQKKELEQSQTNSRPDVDLDKIYGELGQLRQFKNYVQNYLGKLGVLFGLKQGMNTQNRNSNSIFDAINFFKELQIKALSRNNDQQRLLQAQKQIEFLKGRLIQLQPKKLKSKMKQKAITQDLSVELNKSDNDRGLIEYMRQEMKNQYKKLNEALKLSGEKHELLKKKIFQQYRARIIDLISKKDKDEYTITKIEAVLERFIDGLANMSHKEAVLAKEVKLKNEARRQAAVLKQKLAHLQKSLQKDSKKTACVRQPQNLEYQLGKQWLDYVRLQAKALTLQAQNARFIEQSVMSNQKIAEMEQQLQKCFKDLELKESQIESLKNEVIAISRESQQQREKQDEQINNLKARFSQAQKMEKKVSQLSTKDKECNHLKEQIREKCQQIKMLKQRQRTLAQLLEETRRTESVIRQKQRKQWLEESRMQQSLRQIKQSNKELRMENSRLQQQLHSLIQEMSKKNAAIGRLKSEGEQFRIKTVKNDQMSIEKLRSQIRQLKDQLNKSKEEIAKMKRKKDKEISEKENDIQRIKNQTAIEKSSLESVIRALIDTLSGIYCSLDIVARKKGSVVSQPPNFNELIRKPTQIKSTKLSQLFDEVIQGIKA